jgi:hypothetical protein
VNEFIFEKKFLNPPIIANPFVGSFYQNKIIKPLLPYMFLRFQV